MTWSIAKVTRGMELAWQGSLLAFENRRFYKHSYVRVFLWLAAFSVALYMLSITVLTLPFYILRLFVLIISSIFRRDFQHFTSKNNYFLTNWVFNLPFLGLLFMRYVYPQPLDSLFIESLRQIDLVYIKKHSESDVDADGKIIELRPPYATALEKYDVSIQYWKEMNAYLKRTLRDLKWTALLYLCSFIPILGTFVYPLASGYALVRSLGLTSATTVGILIYIIPGTKKLAILFLETLFASRMLTRELLEPYFARLQFDRETKRRWFAEREAILFGFSIAFYFFIRIPIIGMFFFGVAQAAAALLLVKTTEPPPPPGSETEYVQDIKYKDNRLKKKPYKDFTQLEEKK